MNTTREYISVADTAKYVRKALAHNFPGVKFGVRSKSYSGGASIRVEWIDGPTEESVKRVTSRYEGADFDGSIDLKTTHDTLLAGPNGVRAVHFGADYIFNNRHYSDAFIQAALDTFYAEYQGNFEHDGLAKPTVDDYNQGRLWNSFKFSGGFDHDFINREINSLLSRTVAEVK
jgi:hypothetical protein